MAISNKDLINKFYHSFASNDINGMLSCYSDDITFEDPAFGTLTNDRAKSMWRMLLSRGGKNLKVTYKNIQVNGDIGSAEWQAIYPFGEKKRMVTNNVKATFQFKDGKIINHVDKFPLWKWSRQAIGTGGILLGWSSIFRHKIQASGNKMLDAFIAKTQS